MTTKHTPAPWQIDDKTFVYALGPGGTNKFFLSVQAAGPERIGEREKESNARLIAAAPELLAALQEVVRVCKANEAALVDRIYDQCKAAIAKATRAAS